VIYCYCQTIDTSGKQQGAVYDLMLSKDLVLVLSQNTDEFYYYNIWNLNPELSRQKNHAGEIFSPG
jgi:hypothetical protein